MRYVPLERETIARRLVNFETCANISKTGSVIGMQKLFGWPKGGQVRMGGYVYNVGPADVARLDAAGLLRN